MSHRWAIIDVAVVAGAAALYVLMEALGVPKRWSYAAMAVALAAYAIHLALRRTDSLRSLGFRGDNLRAGLLPAGAFTLTAAAALVMWGIARGRTPWHPNVALLLAAYPPWAIAQQLLFQGVLHRRLMLLIRSPALRVLIVATAFASVHAGNRVLLLATFAAGIAWSLLYRRWPNLWLLGASHTVLAALMYHLVLDDQPLTRL